MIAADDIVVCRKCRQPKTADQLSRRAGRPITICKPCRTEEAHKWREDNLGKYNAARRANYRRNPEKFRAANLRDLYGMTMEEYRDRIVAQGGRCPICCQPPKDGTFRVDHNHVTGAVRGLLCNTCNSALGLLLDDPAVVQRAADYLKKEIASLKPKP